MLRGGAPPRSPPRRHTPADQRGAVTARWSYPPSVIGRARLLYGPPGGPSRSWALRPKPAGQGAEVLALVKIGEASTVPLVAESRNPPSGAAWAGVGRTRLAAGMDAAAAGADSFEAHRRSRPLVEPSGHRRPRAGQPAVEQPTCAAEHPRLSRTDASARRAPGVAPSAGFSSPPCPCAASRDSGAPGRAMTPARGPVTRTSRVSRRTRATGCRRPARPPERRSCPRPGMASSIRAPGTR